MIMNRTKNLCKKLLAIAVLVITLCPISMMQAGAVSTEMGDLTNFDQRTTESMERMVDTAYYKQLSAESLKNIENGIEEIRKEALEYQRTHPQTRGISYNGFSYLDGDIFVTKSTSYNGLTGHAAILVGDKVLEITPTYNNGKPAAISLSTWYSRYPKTIVMRYTANRTIPVNAAWYGNSFYINGAGKNNPYQLPSEINSSTKSYCSSLVWKCYNNGANFQFKIPMNTPEQGYEMKVPPVIAPYNFVDYGPENGFKSVYIQNW